MPAGADGRFPGEVNSTITGAPNGKSRTVSQEELFRQVWATPMSRQAREYGISGNGLAISCNLLRVPYPPSQRLRNTEVVPGIRAGG
jgi:hypothetical protein